MTSTDVDGPVVLLRRRAARGGAARCGGFTLVEVMIVIGILIGLAALFLVGSQAMMASARDRATRSIIERLKLGIEKYRQVTGRFPPDGVDFQVKNDQGTPVRGSAALHYALTAPIRVQQMVGGVPRLKAHEPLMEFKESELSEPFPDYPGAREIRDGFDTPLHYDNVVDGRFRPQGGEVHVPPMDDSEHPPDPRTLELSEGGVPNPGRPQSQAYDLWSHGSRGHEVDAQPAEPIGTWNLKQ